MQADEILALYIAFFFQAWKKGYKLGWIYHQMMGAAERDVVLNFFATAEEQGYPLVPEVCRAQARAPFFLATVNKAFSDWMYDKCPDESRFVKNVLANREVLKATAAKWKDAGRESAEDLRKRGWEALDSFGGGTKGLKDGQLLYASRGRKTGKGMSERTWAK